MQFIRLPASLLDSLFQPPALPSLIVWTTARKNSKTRHVHLLSLCLTRDKPVFLLSCNYRFSSCCLSELHCVVFFIAQHCKQLQLRAWAAQLMYLHCFGALGLNSHSCTSVLSSHVPCPIVILLRSEVVSIHWMSVSLFLMPPQWCHLPTTFWVETYCYFLPVLKPDLAKLLRRRYSPLHVNFKINCIHAGHYMASLLAALF